MSAPDVDAPSPVYNPDGETQKSKDGLRAAIAKTTVDNWIPAYTLRDGAGAQVADGHLVDCADLAHPEKFSDLDTVAVSSFDIGSSLQSRNTVGVIAGGQQIYATDTADLRVDDRLEPRWLSRKNQSAQVQHNAIRRNHLSGIGEVPGTLLNQYAMSEYDGVLRVASTISERRGWVDSRQATEGVVTTLAEQDGALRQLGQVGGSVDKTTNRFGRCDLSGELGYIVSS